MIDPGHVVLLPFCSQLAIVMIFSNKTKHFTADVRNINIHNSGSQSTTIRGFRDLNFRKEQSTSKEVHQAKELMVHLEETTCLEDPLFGRSIVNQKLWLSMAGPPNLDKSSKRRAIFKPFLSFLLGEHLTPRKKQARCGHSADMDFSLTFYRLRLADSPMLRLILLQLIVFPTLETKASQIMNQPAQSFQG